MQELNMDEVEQVSGGIIAMSSWLGHIGRAFSVGYGIGTVLMESDTSAYGEDRGAGAWG